MIIALMYMSEPNINYDEIENVMNWFYIYSTQMY